jgi:hypothetical protein
MSDQKNKPETELTDLEPKEDPKGGIIAILIGLKPPAPPSTQLPAVQNPGLTIPGPHV